MSELQVWANLLEEGEVIGIIKCLEHLNPNITKEEIADRLLEIYEDNPEVSEYWINEYNLMEVN